MNESVKLVAHIVLTGIGATAMLDLYNLAQQRLLRIASPDYGLVGRWIGHMRHGRFRHRAIGAAEPAPGETAIGWTAHYLIGIAFAAMLIGIQPNWISQPTLAPAVLMGIATLAFPLLIMHPAMGNGIAASRVARPAMARLRSLATHVAFGFGLYVTAALAAGLK